MSGLYIKKYKAPTPVRTLLKNPPAKARGASFASLKRQIEDQYLIVDSDAIDAIFAAAAAHELGGQTPWLLVVAPPSGLKSELVTLLNKHPKAYPLSQLSPKTFSSGLDDRVTGGKPTALLDEQNDFIVVFKDLTTLLETRQEDRKMILAQLREIYDGAFRVRHASGKDVNWKGRMSLIAGVTSVIDRHTSVMGQLGPRFLFLRLQQPDRVDTALRALDNAVQSKTEQKRHREVIEKAVSTFFNTLPAVEPEISKNDRVTIALLSSLVTAARSPVFRDWRHNEVEHTPAPEMPARLAQALATFVRALALVRGRNEVSRDDMRVAIRIAFDSVPPERLLVLKDLFTQGSATPGQIESRNPDYSDSLHRRTLEDLRSLGLVSVAGISKTSMADTLARPWSLTDDTRNKMEMLAACTTPTARTLKKTKIRQHMVLESARLALKERAEEVEQQAAEWQEMIQEAGWTQEMADECALLQADHMREGPYGD